MGFQAGGSGDMTHPAGAMLVVWSRAVQADRLLGGLAGRQNVDGELPPVPAQSVECSARRLVVFG